LVKYEPGHTIVVFVNARKEWLPNWLTMPHMVVVSDGFVPVDSKGNVLAWDAPYEAFACHPRTVGAFGTAL